MIQILKQGKSVQAKADINAQVRSTVEAILADIETRGDAAVGEYSAKFDKWSPEAFRLSAASRSIRSLPTRAGRTTSRRPRATRSTSR